MPDSDAPTLDSPSFPDLAEIPREVTAEDQEIFRAITSTALTTEQQARIRAIPRRRSEQRAVLAVHWHPEFVPLPLVRERLAATFPAAEEQLIVPTQHNELIELDGFVGVEVDCYSASFNRKVQLLLHFAAERLSGRGDVFRAMIEHTRRYRASQLHELIDSLLSPALEERRSAAAAETGVDRALVELCRIHAGRFRTLLERHEAEVPAQMVKNKLVREYFDALRGTFPDRLINQAQAYLRAVKALVKRDFSLEFFYRTEEVIEEGRALGAGIIIPHPEQFWPILLEDLPVDGIEVWNPQSYEYTQFLIDVVAQKNATSARHDRPLLISMGDDCHLGEKVKPERYQDPAKAKREVGVQPPWDDLEIRKKLIVGNASREQFIREYRDRLGARPRPRPEEREHVEIE